MTFPIPSMSYGQLATILELPGTVGLTGMQEEIVPVQDLSRVLQAAKVKRTQFIRANSHAVTDDTAISWNDASTFTSVHVNGVLTTLDSDLPALTDQKIIIFAGLAVTGTQADYTSAQLLRILGDAGATQALIVEWGDVGAGNVVPTRLAPWSMPIVLSPDETAASLRVAVSGVAAVTRLSVQMVSAPVGVMASFPGV